MTTVSSVSPKSVTYDLNDLFENAVVEQRLREQEHEKYADHPFSSSMTQASLARATRVVDTLRDFKEAGYTTIETALPLRNEPLDHDPRRDLCNQLDRGFVTPKR